jgi:D-glycero-alpha-D-manno-heptose-7-phosphate kinase
LENSILIYSLGVSRDSSKIIVEQIKNTKNKNEKSIQAMMELKKIALVMKNAILKGDFEAFAECLNSGWIAKKKMASVISNDHIDKTYNYVMKNGGKAAKVSGAGGGGFMMIIVDPVKKSDLIKALRKNGGTVFDPSIVEKGSQGWTIY